MAYLKTEDLVSGVIVIAYSDFHEVLFTATSSRDGYSVVSKQGYTDITYVEDEQALQLLASQVEKERGLS